MNKKRNKIAKLFLEVRTVLGLSQTEFARTLEISQPYYCQIENGDRVPNGELVMRAVELRKKNIEKSKA